MATVTRQPFAPIEGSRLQNLTSLKNRQNAISTSSPIKRKASDIVDTDDFENVDPTLSAKRSKGGDGLLAKDSFIKPSAYILKSASANDVSVSSPSKLATPRPRSFLNPKSPATKLNIGVVKSSPMSAPAGRSPTRGKRSGILSSRRRTGGSISRIDPPVFGLPSKSTAPFSLDAALKGTIPSYTSRPTSSSLAVSARASAADVRSLDEPDLKSSWTFEIHEDTPEQEMTNLLQHSTCVLDISSDEESESRRQRERVEGKENVPPADDVSQTSRPRAARAAADLAEDNMMVEKERRPLGEMDVKDYYSEGCDETSVVIVSGDEDEEQPEPPRNDFEFAPELQPSVPATPEIAVAETVKTVDQLMQRTDELVPSAAVLEPMEGTGESFEVWESGSAKDETEAPATPC
jgi:hypothetical protein